MREREREVFGVILIFVISLYMYRQVTELSLYLQKGGQLTTKPGLSGLFITS